MSDLELIKATLIEDGYTGLHCEGECACTIDDLAPCGEMTREAGEDYINGCSGGHKFTDDKNPGFWVIKSSNSPMTEDQWERARREWL